MVPFFGPPYSVYSSVAAPMLSRVAWDLFRLGLVKRLAA